MKSFAGMASLFKFSNKSGIVGLMFALVMSSASFGQDVSQDHIDAAKAALKAGKSTTNLDNILPNLAERMKGRLILSQPHLEAEISDIVDEAAIEIAPRRGDLQNEVARLYANVFTKEELEQLAKFYQTSAGQKLLEESPVLIREIGKASRTWSTGIDRDLRAAIAKKLTALGEAQNKLNDETKPAENN